MDSIHEEETEFPRGGGTFFENLFCSLERDEVSKVIEEPLPRGHAFFYESGERVAIAPMLQGVRHELILSFSMSPADEQFPSSKERMSLIQRRTIELAEFDRIKCI